MLKKRSILKKSGQLWVSQEEVLDAGYEALLGTLVEINGHTSIFELSARMVAFKVGLDDIDGFVWWLQPVRH